MEFLPIFAIVNHHISHTTHKAYEKVFQAAGTTYWRGVRFLRLYNPYSY